MSPRFAASLLMSLLMSALASSAGAQTPPPSPSASEGVEIGGLVDVYFDYYSTRPAGDALYRTFDTRHNQFALSMAEVWLSKAATPESRVGFKFRLNFGPASSRFIHAFEPGGESYQNIQEAFVTYLAPVGKGLQIDAGVFVTPTGIEVIEAKDDMNYSRGFLFTLALPAYHSGVRLSYAANSKVSFSAAIVNGWNNIVENNTGKTLIGAVTVKPTTALAITEYYIVGPEQGGTNDDVRHLSDTLLTLAAHPRISLAGEFDYGRDSVDGTKVAWKGLAGFAKLQVTPAIAISPRFEWYDDPNAFTTGTAQKLKELTGTLELKAADNLLWRIEARQDWSDKTPFSDAEGKPTGSQSSIGFSLLYSFGARIR